MTNKVPGIEFHIYNHLCNVDSWKRYFKCLETKVLKFMNVAMSYCYSRMYVIVVESLTCVHLSVTPWTVARQAPLVCGVLQ